MTRSDHIQRFDEAMRSRHADAVEHISGRTRVQLHNRLQTAMSTPVKAAAHRPAWGWALACSLALAVAFGLHLRSPRPDEATPVASERSGDNGDLVASLDETPDLYLWLASNDASGFVSE